MSVLRHVVDAEDLGAPRQVAAAVASHLAGRVARDRDEVRLAVHEAVVNALVHGGPPVTVSIDTAADDAEVIVTDVGRGPGGLGTPRPRDAGTPRPRDERGRGMALLRACADDVQVTARRGGGWSVRLRYAAVVTTPQRP